MLTYQVVLEGIKHELQSLKPAASQKKQCFDRPCFSSAARWFTEVWLAKIDRRGVHERFAKTV